LTIKWKLLYSYHRRIKKSGGILLKEYFKNLDFREFKNPTFSLKKRLK